MTPLHALAEWLSHTALSRAFNEAHYLVFGGFMAAHLIGIALLSGMVLFADLRVVGAGLRALSPERALRAVRPWLFAGAALAAASGSWLFVADPLKYAANPVFRAKALLLIAAVALQLALHRPVLAGKPASFGLKSLASAALLAWLSTAIAGRVVGLV